MIEELCFAQNQNILMRFINDKKIAFELFVLGEILKPMKVCTKYVVIMFNKRYFCQHLVAI